MPAELRGGRVRRVGDGHSAAFARVAEAPGAVIFLSV